VFFHGPCRLLSIFLALPCLYTLLLHTNQLYTIRTLCLGLLASHFEKALVSSNSLADPFLSYRQFTKSTSVKMVAGIHFSTNIFPRARNMKFDAATHTDSLIAHKRSRSERIIRCFRKSSEYIVPVVEAHSLSRHCLTLPSLNRLSSTALSRLQPQSRPIPRLHPLCLSPLLQIQQTRDHRFCHPLPPHYLHPSRRSPA
jgi:hypothetical protein